MPHNFKVSLLPNLAAILLFFFIGWFAYEAFWPFRTIEFTSGSTPLAMVSDKVEIGSAAAFRMNYCKYTNAPASIARQIRYENGYVVTLPEIKGFSNKLSSQTGALCQEIVSASTVIPDGVPTGYAKIRLLYRYPVSILQIEDVYVETKVFEVVPKGSLEAK